MSLKQDIVLNVKGIDKVKKAIKQMQKLEQAAIEAQRAGSVSLGKKKIYETQAVEQTKQYKDLQKELDKSNKDLAKSNKSLASTQEKLNAARDKTAAKTAETAKKEQKAAEKKAFAQQEESKRISHSQKLQKQFARQAEGLTDDALVNRISQKQEDLTRVGRYLDPTIDHRRSLQSKLRDPKLPDDKRLKLTEQLNEAQRAESYLKSEQSDLNKQVSILNREHKMRADALKNLTSVQDQENSVLLDNAQKKRSVQRQDEIAHEMSKKMGKNQLREKLNHLQGLKDSNEQLAGFHAAAHRDALKRGDDEAAQDLKARISRLDQEKRLINKEMKPYQQRLDAKEAITAKQQETRKKNLAKQDKRDMRKEVRRQAKAGEEAIARKPLKKAELLDQRKEMERLIGENDTLHKDARKQRKEAVKRDDKRAVQVADDRISNLKSKRKVLNDDLKEINQEIQKKDEIVAKGQKTRRENKRKKEQKDDLSALRKLNKEMAQDLGDAPTLNQLKEKRAGVTEKLNKLDQQSATLNDKLINQSSTLTASDKKAIELKQKQIESERKILSDQEKNLGRQIKREESRLNEIETNEKLVESQKASADAQEKETKSKMDAAELEKEMNQRKKDARKAVKQEASSINDSKEATDRYNEAQKKRKDLDDQLKSKNLAKNKAGKEQLQLDRDIARVEEDQWLQEKKRITEAQAAAEKEKIENTSVADSKKKVSESAKRLKRAEKELARARKKGTKEQIKAARANLKQAQASNKVNIKFDIQVRKTKRLTGATNRLGSSFLTSSNYARGLALSASTLGGSVRTMFSGAAFHAKNLPLMAFFAMLAGLRLAWQGMIRPIGEYEKQLANVRKTTGLTSLEIKQLGNSMIDLSSSIGVAAQELVKIAEVAGQMGIRGRDNILNFTATVSRLVQVAELAPDEAAKSMSKLGQAFDIPIEQAEKMGSVVNELSNTTTATSKEIIDALRRLGPLAEKLGITFSETAGAAATLISTGLVAPRVGTNLRNLFILMQTKGHKVSKFMGLDTLQEFNDRLENDTFPLMLEYLDKLRSIQKTAQASHIQDLYGSRNFPALQSLSELLEADLLPNIETANEAWKTGNSLIDEQAKKVYNLGDQIDLFMTRVKNFFLGQGEGAIVGNVRNLFEGLVLSEYDPDILKSMRKDIQSQLDELYGDLTPERWRESLSVSVDAPGKIGLSLVDDLIYEKGLVKRLEDINGILRDRVEQISDDQKKLQDLRKRLFANTASGDRQAGIHELVAKSREQLTDEGVSDRFLEDAKHYAQFGVDAVWDNMESKYGDIRKYLDDNVDEFQKFIDLLVIANDLTYQLERQVEKMRSVPISLADVDKMIVMTDAQKEQLQFLQELDRSLDVRKDKPINRELAEFQSIIRNLKNERKLLEEAENILSPYVKDDEGNRVLSENVSLGQIEAFRFYEQTLAKHGNTLDEYIQRYDELRNKIDDITISWLEFDAVAARTMEMLVDFNFDDLDYGRDISTDGMFGFDTDRLQAEELLETISKMRGIANEVLMDNIYTEDDQALITPIQQHLQLLDITFGLDRDKIKKNLQILLDDAIPALHEAQTIKITGDFDFDLFRESLKKHIDQTKNDISSLYIDDPVDDQLRKIAEAHLDTYEKLLQMISADKIDILKPEALEELTNQMESMSETPLFKNLEQGKDDLQDYINGIINLNTLIDRLGEKGVSNVEALRRELMRVDKVDIDIDDLVGRNLLDNVKYAKELFIAYQEGKITVEEMVDALQESVGAQDDLNAMIEEMRSRYADVMGLIKQMIQDLAQLGDIVFGLSEHANQFVSALVNAVERSEQLYHAWHNYKQITDDLAVAMKDVAKHSKKPIEGIEKISDGVEKTTDSLGKVAENMASNADNLESGAANTAAAAQQLADAQKYLQSGASFELTASVVGVVAGIAGMAGSIVNAITQSRREARRQREEAIRVSKENARKLEEALINLNSNLQTVTGVEGQQLGADLRRYFEIVQSWVGRVEGKDEEGNTVPLTAEQIHMIMRGHAESGETIGSIIQRMTTGGEGVEEARKLLEDLIEAGILDEGAPLPDLESLREILEGLTEHGAFDDTTTGLIASLQFLSNFIEIDAVESFRRFMAGLQEMEHVPDWLKDTLAGVDLSTEEGQQAFRELLQGWALQIQEGTFDPSQFGGMTPEEFKEMMDFLLQTADQAADDSNITTIGVDRTITDVQANAVIALLEQQVFYTKEMAKIMEKSYGLGDKFKPEVNSETNMVDKLNQSMEKIYQYNITFGDINMDMDMSADDPMFAKAAGEALREHLLKYQGRSVRIG